MRQSTILRLRLLWRRLYQRVYNWHFHRPAVIRRAVRRLQRRLTRHDTDVALYVACHLWQDRRDVEAPSVLPRRDRELMDEAIRCQIIDLFDTLSELEQIRLLTAMAIGVLYQGGSRDHIVALSREVGPDGEPDPCRIRAALVVAAGKAAEELVDAIGEQGFNIPGGGL
ncbi:MAG: hypothetical protein ACOC8H_00060 [bacterium]